LQVSRLLQYAPQKRFSPYEAMTHTFFDELRDPATVLPNGKPLPPLFNWLPGELDDLPEAIVSKLRPGRPAGGSSSSSAQAQPQ
jgi:glycogen synthase kinase 3 beta